MEIKRQGRGGVVQYPSITYQDLETIYSYLTSDREDSRLPCNICSICIQENNP